MNTPTPRPRLRLRRLRDDDRAVSSTVSFIVFTAISLILITVLITGATAYADQHRTNLATDAATIVVDDTTHTIKTVERTTSRTGVTTTTTTVETLAYVDQYPVVITITDYPSNNTVAVTATTLTGDVSVTRTLTSSYHVGNTTVRGGTYHVVGNASSNTITVTKHP